MASFGDHSLCSSFLASDDSKILRIKEDMAISDHIHLNAAGASPMPLPVLNAVKGILDNEYLVGGYEAADCVADKVEGVYHSIGKLIGSIDPLVEIALVDSATTAWVKAFYSVPLEAGDVVLVSKTEYAANYVAILQQTKRKGATIIHIPSDTCGRVSVSGLEHLLQTVPKIKLVCITWIPTNGGIVNDAAGIGNMCEAFRQSKTPSASYPVYILDACQAVGQICVDVRQLKCHMLAATGRKYLRGPRGTGFLYVKKELLDILDEPITIDHSAAPWVALNRYEIVPTAKRYEQWEKNISGLVGLGCAIDYLLDEEKVGMRWAMLRIQALASQLRNALCLLSFEVSYSKALDSNCSAYPFIISLWDLGKKEDPNSQCGLVTFSVSGIAAGDVKQYLHQMKIFVSVSQPPSTLIDATERHLPSVVRASLHYYNTELDISMFCNALKKLLQR